MIAEITVALKERSYPIYIGPDLLATSQYYRPYFKGRQIMIVTDDNVGPRYATEIADKLSDYTLDILQLPSGEESKTLANLEQILEKLLIKRFNRNACIIALGGGVIGDIAGFAAACYQRGINFVQIPTTLLAQVDSSVGGKTAVNHRLGKNMIGAFHQPVCVISDTNTLSTLSDREFRAGLAEVIKYGVLWDSDFFVWLETHLPELLRRDAETLTYAIRRSCEIKSSIVSQDEQERGVRALLNLGHTFGHAIESGLGYGVWLHGEAVAAGICMAADLAHRTGRLTREELQRIGQLMHAANLPTKAPKSIDPPTFLDLMARDKKAADSGIRLVLPEAIGKTRLCDDFKLSALQETLDACRQVS